MTRRSSRDRTSPDGALPDDAPFVVDVPADLPSVGTRILATAARSAFRNGALAWSLVEVIAMAHNGQIHAETAEFPLEQAVAMYEKLKAGHITGRAVLIQ